MSDRYIIEPQRRLEVSGNFDTVVAGGGIAGIAASLSAARAGAKVLLIEKNFILGGLATAGLVTIYLPLCDGNGKQVSFGICEELLKLSIKHGDEGMYPHAWLEGGSHSEKAKTRYMVQYNPFVFAILAEQLVLSNNVTILYGTSICSATVTDGIINAVIIENKSGRSAVMAKSFVDATGDADLCFLAGEKTSLYQRKNILASWYYYKNKEKVKLKMLGYSENVNGDINSQDNQNVKRYVGIDAAELTGMMIDSHNNQLDDFLKEGKLSESHSLTSISTIPQVRMTRRLDGVTLLTDEPYKHYNDSIGAIGNWRKRGPAYEIPFSCLYGKAIKNLITAGRCISTDDIMWDITRVIPACAVTGQAAGAAAAMTDDFDSLNINDLQKHLTKNGVLLFL